LHAPRYSTLRAATAPSAHYRINRRAISPGASPRLPAAFGQGQAHAPPQHVRPREPVETVYCGNSASGGFARCASTSAAARSAPTHAKAQLFGSSTGCRRGRVSCSSAIVQRASNARPATGQKHHCAGGLVPGAGVQTPSPKIPPFFPVPARLSTCAKFSSGQSREPLRASSCTCHGILDSISSGPGDPMRQVTARLQQTATGHPGFSNGQTATRPGQNGHAGAKRTGRPWTTCEGRQPLAPASCQQVKLPLACKLQLQFLGKRICINPACDGAVP